MLIRMRNIWLEKRGAFELGMKELIIGAILLIVLFLVCWQILSGRIGEIFK